MITDRRSWPKDTLRSIHHIVDQLKNNCMRYLLSKQLTDFFQTVVTAQDRVVEPATVRAGVYDSWDGTDICESHNSLIPPVDYSLSKRIVGAFATHVVLSLQYRTFC